ncbi:hypothetical protein RN001_004994 [Aquatica leii]|uniref:CHHC U11-48K-type domain-containing protein n=1 Tax=Aquatica leii TaxID=1421715 RepID=A0AAN7Q6A1_9COLE|nr:hypothetical protein RN001_004994 [Aquatica leii]
MMSNKGDNEKRIICPYNPAHTIIPHRFQTHLVKCRKSYPDTKIVACIYNNTHRVHEPELAFHHDNCPDRLGLDKIIFAPTPTDRRIQVPVVDIEPTEVWDDEECESYDPEQYCLNNPVLRKKDTLPKAQRKNFRWEERQRMQQFSSDNISRQFVETEKPSTSDVHRRRPHTIRKEIEQKNKVIADDVSEMLKKVHLGANTAIVPPRKDSNTSKYSQVTESENINFSNVSESQSFRDNSYNVTLSSFTQVGHGAKPKKITRGRGCAFDGN